MYIGIMERSQQVDVEANHSAAGYALKLPGKRLNLSALLYAKRFQAYGYKVGRLAAFRELQADEMGTLEDVKTKAVTMV